MPVARRTPGVASVAPLTLTDVLVQEAEGNALLVAGIDLVADRAVRDYTFRWTEGEAEDPFAMLTQPRSIVLNERFARRYGLQLGATVHLNTSQGTQQLIIRGFLQPEGVAKALGGRF